MINYIKAELYRNFHHTYFWIWTGVFAISSILINILFKGPGNTSLDQLMGMSLMALLVPIYIVLCYIDMTSAEEQKNKTMKNVLSFGLSRNKFVLSKLIVSIILSFLGAFIIMGAFYGSGALLFKAGKDFSTILPIFIKSLIAAVPLWIAAVSIGLFLSIAFSSNTIFSIVYVILFSATAGIIKFLMIFVSKKFITVYNMLITVKLSDLSPQSGIKLTNHVIFTDATLGIVYTIIFTALAMIYFSKKEIK